jgi:hypothetical protein
VKKIMVLAKALPYFSASLLTFESGRTSLTAAALAATGIAAGIDEPVDDEDGCAAAELDVPVDDEDGCGLDDGPGRTGDVLLVALRALSLAFRASFSDNDDDDDDGGDVLALRSLNFAFRASFCVDDNGVAFRASFCVDDNGERNAADDEVGCELDDDEDEDGCGLEDGPGRTSASLLTFESGRTSLTAAALAATGIAAGIDEPVDDEDGCAAAELDVPVDDEDGCGLDDGPGRTGDVLLVALRALSLAFRASFSDNDDDDDDGGDVLALRSLNFAFRASFCVDDNGVAFRASFCVDDNGERNAADDEVGCAFAALIKFAVESKIEGAFRASFCVDDNGVAFRASFCVDDNGERNAADDEVGCAFAALIKFAVESKSCSTETTRLLFWPAVLATSEVTGGGDVSSILHVVEEDGWTGVLRKVFLLGNLGNHKE